MTNTMKVYPAECRERRATYRGDVIVKVGWSVEGKTQGSLERVAGQIPIMVKSDACHLARLTPKDLIRHGEEAEGLLNVSDKYIFDELTKGREEDSYYKGYMTQKLFSFAQGRCAEESADNPMNQELLLSGHLVLMVLKEKLESWLLSVKMGLERVMKNKSSKSGFVLNAVLLDGRLVGYLPDAIAKDVVDELRLFKVCGLKKIPPVLEICLVPKTEVASLYPGVYLFSTPARMVRPVLNLAVNQTEMIGTFEQVFMDIAVTASEVHPGVTTHVEISEQSMLSVIATLTPFSDFNQSPRNMYQCQMGKQTMGTPLHAYQHRADNKLYRIQTPQSPIAAKMLQKDWTQMACLLYMNQQTGVVTVERFRGSEDAYVDHIKILGRMMIESMAGKSAALHGMFHDATPFTFSEDQSAADYFGELLSAAGYNYFGTERLYSGIDGRELQADIFFGVVYYQRLRHMVSDKFQAHICIECGSLLSPVLEKPPPHTAAASFEAKRKWKCLTCGRSDKISIIAVPYVLRYLLAELAVMGIKVKLDVK
nr:hypothetical protein BaRGS_034344 [Batillaria attramentaria]